MARPRADDAQDGLVEFAPTPRDPEAEAIYEVDLGATPAGKETPTPGIVLDRTRSPLPAAGAPPPSVGELRASFAGRHRELHGDRRGRRNPTAFVVLGLMALGCAGVLTVAVGASMTLVVPAPRAEPALQSPQEFEGVPVERGLRRGDHARPVPTRPTVPTP